jgi:hypothetical protein
MENKKPSYQSKTLWFNLSGLIAFQVISRWVPDFSKAICANEELTLTIGVIIVQAIFLINALLRFATKDRVSFLALLLLVGCSSVPQKLDTNIFYRRDLPICEQDFGCFEGMAVLPKKDFYKFQLSPKGGAEIDLFVATTAHRNDTFEPTNSSWLFWKKKNSYEYKFSPNPSIEGDGDSNLVFQTFEKKKGRHSWAIILFQHPKYQLPYTLYCNGYTIRFDGVGGCQSKTGLKQGIKFEEPVAIESDANCPVPKKVNDFYEWPIGYKECGYTFRSKSGKLGTLMTVGYKGELVRETE